jgi:integrase
MKEGGPGSQRPPRRAWNRCRSKLCSSWRLPWLPGGSRSWLPRRRGASVRTIPLAQITRDVVAAHLAAHPPLDGFVFVNDDGRPIRRSAFGSVWRTAVAAAGTPAGTGFHELRHF